MTMENQNSFFLEKTYNAPIELVWQVITQREHLKNWYFNFAEDWKLEVAATFQWYAEDTECTQWLHAGKMLEIIPEKKLVHTWEYPGFAGTSILSWELEEIDAQHTKIALTHLFKVPFDSSVQALKIENFAAGWNEILNNSLTNYLNKITS